MTTINNAEEFETVALSPKNGNKAKLNQFQSEPIPILHHPPLNAHAASAPSSYHSETVSLLMDLPMIAHMGVGGSTKLMLLRSLKIVNNELNQMNDDEHSIDGDDKNGYKAVPMTSTSNIPNLKDMESEKCDIEQALNQKYTLNLMIAVLQALFGTFLGGWNTAILNVPQNIVQNEVTHMNDAEFASLQSLFCGGALIGALSAGPLQDRCGRKKAMLIIDVVYIISSVIIILFATGVFGAVDDQKTYSAFWIGRFLVGIASGAATAIVPAYLGEISPPLIRGAIGTTNQLSFTVGIFTVQVLGYKTILGGADTWHYLFFANILFPVIQFLTACSFPETPKWLVQKGKDDEARKALQRLRNTNDVRYDMMLIKGSQKTQNASNDTSNCVNDGSNSEKGPFGMDKNMWKAVRRATIISVILMWLQQFSGINAIFFYSATILSNAGITSDKAQWLGSISIAFANSLAVLIPAFTIDKFGRKVLLIVSCIVMIIASVLVSIAIMLNDENVIWQYSSIGFLILFVVGFEIGLGAIPWLMMAELAPMKYRGIIVAIGTANNWGSNLLIAQFSGQIIAAAYFYPFAIDCFLAILFTIKFIPETNGKTAAQIQNELIKMKSC